MGSTTLTKNVVSLMCCTALVSSLTLMVAISARAQSPAEAPGVSNVTVVTLYSETRNSGKSMDQGAPKRPPIQIVNGGVKGPEKSCWELSPSGKMTPVAGDCYILRSAGPGEEPPAR